MNTSILHVNTTHIPSLTDTVILSTETSVTKKGPLLPDDVKLVFEYIIHIGLFYLTSIFGLIVNIINIIVYKKQGLSESITLGYFALACSDLFVSGMPMLTATCYALKILDPNSRVDYISVHYVNATFIRDMAYSLSCSITAILSCERCVCVVQPFKVKIIFTRNRTALIIAGFIVFHIIVYIPIFATHQLRWQKTPSRNNTEILRVWFAPNRDIIEKINATLMSIILPTIAQVIVTCCACVMVHGLRKSSKFRLAMSSQRFHDVISRETSSNDMSVAASASCPSLNENLNKNKVLSLRDTRLVRSMVIIVVILSACNVPFLMLMYAKLAEPELNIRRAYHNTYSFVYSINYVLASLNASLNIFVYYNTSTKYRRTFRKTILCKKF